MPDIVGLSVEGDALRGVEVAVGRDGSHVVKRTGEIDIPELTFEHGRLRDPDTFGAELRRLWDEAGFRSKRVRLAIDGRLAVVRRTELPSVDPTKLRQAAGYDIAELLNYPIGDAVFDVDEIERFEREDAVWAKALVVAVEESALGELVSAVESAGLGMHDTDLAAEALARSVRIDDGAAPSPPDSGPGGAPVAIVACEDTTTNIVVRDASGLLFARTLNIGVGETTISMADELESALAQLSGSDHTGLDDSASESAVGVSNVVEGIRRTLGYYSAELDQRPISRVVVLGGRGGAAGLVASIENTLGVPCSAAPSSAEWPAEVDSAGFEIALGAAVGAAKSATRHLVLTSDRDRAARDRRRRLLAGVAATLPVAVLLVFASMAAWADVVDARDRADDTEAANGALALRIAELTESEQRVEEWELVTADVRSVESQQVRFEIVIAELAESMPADVRLVDIQLSNAPGEDLPIGYAGPSPAGIVSITGVAGDLDGVGRWLEAANETVTIDGLWLDQSTFGPVGVDGDDGAVFTVKGVITAAAGPTNSLITADDIDQVDTTRESGR